MGNECEIKAYAKINLGLDIIGRREDGYHLLRMIMQNVGLADRLVFSKNRSGEIRIRSNLTYLPTGPKNLVFKAVEMIRNEYGISEGIDVRIEKKIPIAAGLAGGSSNAAAAIIAMDSLFGLGMDTERMCGLGVRIGADVPYCIVGGTALAEGIGEKLSALPAMPECQILLVKPPFGISTKEAYQAYDNKPAQTHPDIDALIEALENKDLDGICNNLGNVLESVSCAEYPELDMIKDRMRELGAKNALMSGSGPTLFGIFDDRDAAQRAYIEFKTGKYGKDTYLCTPV